MVLERLYEEISLSEEYSSITKEQEAVRKKQMEHYRSFIEKLGSPLDQEFIDIMDEQLETVPFNFYHMFEEGFKLGAKMMIEILYDKEEEEE